jgi:hypothetical protein
VICGFKRLEARSGSHATSEPPWSTTPDSCTSGNADHSSENSTRRPTLRSRLEGRSRHGSREQCPPASARADGEQPHRRQAGQWRSGSA